MPAPGAGDQPEEEDVRERRCRGRRARRPSRSPSSRARGAAPAIAPGGQGERRRDRGRRERDDERPDLLQVPAREQAAEPVAERHADDCERAEHLPARLRADEQRDADEADATPTSRIPVTRLGGRSANAISAVKIGTAAWMIEARPESIRVSPHESSQNGIAVFTSATTTSQRRVCPQLRERLPAEPITSGATIASVSAASPSRPTISVDGSSSRDRDLDEHERRAPDQGETEQHQTMAPARTPSCNAPGGPSGSPVTLDHLTQVAEQPLHRPSVSPTGSWTESASCSGATRTTSSSPSSRSSGRSTAATSTRRCS